MKKLNREENNKKIIIKKEIDEENENEVEKNKRYKLKVERWQWNELIQNTRNNFRTYNELMNKKLKVIL